jgi:UDP-GlcNAc:undecaprenyl-phosphate GlcNAc-1-phosphate transferase
MTYSIVQFFLLGFLTLIFVGLITPPIRQLALRIDAVDAPTLARKAQKEPVPYLGGVAIAIGIVAASYGSLLAVDFTLDSLKLSNGTLG